MWAASLSRRATMARWMVFGVCNLEKKDAKAAKEAKDTIDAIDAKATKEAKEARDAIDAKVAKESKAAKKKVKDNEKQEESKKKKEKCDSDSGRVRRCDLPLYDDIECPKCLPKEQHKKAYPPPECSLVFNTVSCMRKEVWMLSDKLEELYEEFWVYLDEAEKKFWELYEILRKEENLHYRINFITAGAISGLLLARNKCNRFVKFLYMLTGALIAAAICYPDEAKDVVKFVYEHVMMLYAYMTCDKEAGECEEVFGQKRLEDEADREVEEVDDAPRAAVIPHRGQPPYCITPRLMPEREPPEPSPCPSSD